MKNWNPVFPRRKWIRLKGYDYTRPGGYFITICTSYNECMFGKIRNDKMILNQMGQRVDHAWQDLADHFAEIGLDEYIIMPNHIHGIIIIKSNDKIQRNLREYLMGREIRTDLINQIRTNQFHHEDSNHENWILMKSPGISLGKIIRYFKARCTRMIRSAGYRHFKWHGLYYDHIIRNQYDLSRIRNYIRNNPRHWDRNKKRPYEKDKRGR